MSRLDSLQRADQDRELDIFQIDLTVNSDNLSEVRIDLLPKHLLVDSAKPLSGSR